MMQTALANGDDADQEHKDIGPGDCTRVPSMWESDIQICLQLTQKGLEANPRLIPRLHSANAHVPSVLTLLQRLLLAPRYCLILNIAERERGKPERSGGPRAWRTRVVAQDKAGWEDHVLALAVAQTLPCEAARSSPLHRSTHCIRWIVVHYISSTVIKGAI